MNHHIRAFMLGILLLGLYISFLIHGSAVIQAQEQSGPTATPVYTVTPVPTAIPVPAPTAGAASEFVEQVSDTISEFDRQTIWNLIVSFVVVALVATFGGRLVYSLLRRFTDRSTMDLDDVILRAIRPLIGWLIAAIGFQIATSRLEFLSDAAREVLESVYFILYLFVVVAAVWRLGDYLVDWYIDKNREHMDANLVAQVVPLLKRLTHLALLLIGGIVLAAHFGINVLAISAALGITGFAIALAAQDTIANMISGLAIMVDHPFRLGDRIEVPDVGTWGDVVEIGIRSSKVITRDNRMVIIPNSNIADNTVINYSLPDSSYRLESDVGIGTNMDIPTVQRLIREAVRKVDGVLLEKPVDVWFTEFGDSSNTFRVRWWVETYADKRRVTDSVNTAIQQLALREGIDIPNPTYTLENQLCLRDEDIEKIVKALMRLELEKANETLQE